jgi:serine/threonine-protein kinase
LESAALTGAKEVVGTALYIAPEQVSKAETGPAADVYALGAVAYHCLSGHPPFEGESPIAIAIQHVQDEPPPLPLDVPDSVRALVARAMAKNPADRFPSAAAMAAEASRMASGDATTVLMGAVSAGAVPLGAAAGADRTVPVRPVSPPTLTGPPGSPVPPLSPARRNRTLLTVAAAVIGLGVAASLLVWANPGDIFRGGTPETTPSVATSAGPNKQGVGGGKPTTPSRRHQTTPTKAVNPPPASGPSSAPSSPPASASPSGSPSDSESPSASPSDQASEPGEDNGGGDGDNDGDGGNQGPGGGGGGSDSGRG